MPGYSFACSQIAQPNIVMIWFSASIDCHNLQILVVSLENEDLTVVENEDLTDLTWVVTGKYLTWTMNQYSPKSNQ